VFEAAYLTSMRRRHFIVKRAGLLLQCYRCRSITAVLQVQVYCCSATGAGLLLQCYRCRSITAVLQVQVYYCSATDADLLLKCYRCRSITAVLQVQVYYCSATGADLIVSDVTRVDICGPEYMYNKLGARFLVVILCYTFGTL